MDSIAGAPTVQCPPPPLCSPPPTNTPTANNRHSSAAGPHHTAPHGGDALRRVYRQGPAGGGSQVGGRWPVGGCWLVAAARWVLAGGCWPVGGCWQAAAARWVLAVAALAASAFAAFVAATLLQFCCYLPMRVRAGCTPWSAYCLPPRQHPAYRSCLPLHRPMAPLPAILPAGTTCCTTRSCWL